MPPAGPPAGTPPRAAPPIPPGIPPRPIPPIIMPAISGIFLICESAEIRITSGLLFARSFTVISRVSGFTAVIVPAFVTNVPNTTSSAVTFSPSSLFTPRART